MAFGDWLASRYDSAARTVGSVTNYVENKTAAVVHSAKATAHELYDSGKATLTNVETAVVKKTHQVEASVDEAKHTAHQLYDRGKAGLSKVGDALKDDSNVAGKLKYVNPMFYAGKGTEYLGKGVKLVGQGLNLGVDFLDKHSKDIPEPLKAPAGVVAGALGFGGSLVEGVGGIVDWAGRMEQGDTKTIKDTGHTIQKVGEGLAYVDGKSRAAVGSAVELAGAKSGSDLLKGAGSSYRQLGEAEANLAGADTKRVLDNVGQAGVHYIAKAGEAEGAAVHWVGEKTGSQRLSEAGAQVQGNAGAMADRTANGLTRGIDKAVDDRKKEYAENGSYAVPRDLTRVTAEVAALVVAPEAILGKAGVVAKTGEGLKDAARLSRLADTVGDGADAAAHVGEGGRVGSVSEETRGAVENAHLPQETQAEIERLREKYSQETQGLKSQIAQLNTPTPEAAQKIQEADRAYNEAQAAFKAAPPGPEKGALQKAMKNARDRLGKANTAARDNSAISDLQNTLNKKEHILSRMGDVEMAPSQGPGLSPTQSWWDKAQGAQQEQASLAEHVANHRAEMGIPPGASDAEASQIYLQKARDFISHPPDGTLLLRGTGEPPSTILYDPKTRILGVYNQVGDGLVPVTIHQLNAVSEEFPRGHYMGQGNDMAQFLDSR